MSNAEQGLWLLMFLGWGAVGIALMWFWGFDLIEKFIKFLDRKAPK
jgi:hypothetical protein